MISKAYTIALLAAVLAGSAEAGHIRHSHNKRVDAPPNICGTKGYDREQGNYFYDNGGKLNSYAACSAACVADTQCKSFAYSSKECMFFNIPLTGNFDEDKGSSDFYYDIGCLSAAGSIPSPTSKKSSTTPAATTSSTSKSSTTPSATPSSTPKSSSTPSSTTPSTTSSSKSSTAAGTTPSSSAGGAAATPSTTGSTPAKVDFPTGNPYASKGCPMPSALAITDLKSTIDSKGTNTASVKIQYGNGTFSCPGRCGSYNGQFDCNCDPNGLLRVISDGRSWIWVQEWYWCDAQEQRPTKGYATLALTLNYTGLADHLSCDKASGTCTQSKPLLAPVDGYGGGGIIGFSPIDVNGDYLPNCPSQAGHSPIVTNTATCTANAAAKTP